MIRLNVFSRRANLSPRISSSNSMPVLSALDVPVNASAIHVDSVLFTVLSLLGMKFVSIDYVPIVELLEF